MNSNNAMIDLYKAVINDCKELIKQNIDAFSDHVCKLVEDLNKRQEMGRKAIASSQRYRVDRIMPIWKQLFWELATEGK